MKKPKCNHCDTEMELQGHWEGDNHWGAVVCWKRPKGRGNKMTENKKLNGEGGYYWCENCKRNVRPAYRSVSLGMTIFHSRVCADCGAWQELFPVQPNK